MDRLNLIDRVMDGHKYFKCLMKKTNKEVRRKNTFKENINRCRSEN